MSAVRRAVRNVAGGVLLAVSRAWASTSTVLELAGFGLVTVAAWRVDPTAGLLAAGISCLLIGYLMGGRE